VAVNIWARSNAIDQIDYARTISAKLLNYFEKYFSVKFPLPKQVGLTKSKCSKLPKILYITVKYNHTFIESVLNYSCIGLVGHDMRFEYFPLVIKSFYKSIYELKLCS
jgi:hypothetical protein